MIKTYINKNILKVMKVLCLGGLMAFSSNAYSQLSGTKTLGTGGDYTSWSALASAIRTSGVNGKLTVTLLNDMSLGSTRVTFQNLPIKLLLMEMARNWTTLVMMRLSY